MALLDLLKDRYSISKKFTERFQDEVRKAVRHYKLEDEEKETLEKLININTRYEFKIPYIFATHESMLASLFDKTPDLVFRGRGADDQDKEEKIRAAYDYLVDKLDLDSFMTTTAWWFILIGWASAHAAFKTETREVPFYDEITGEPVLDEEGNPVMREEYVFNDPILTVGDPLKEYFSPESKFSNRADEIPFYFREENMSVDEIKATYGKRVEADATIKMDKIDQKETKESDDIKRAKVKFYYGTLPSNVKSEVKDWDYDAWYYIVYVNKQILHKERVDDKLCRLGRWHGVPNEFFGFGIGKTLAEFQKELAVRRGQQVRYADVMAFPKIAYDMAVEIDEKALLDPRMGVTLGYRDKPPSYLSPPDMPNTIMIGESKAREDAQFVSGMLDLSKGASDSKVVETATGQTIFAEAAERRIRQAKRQYGRFYREVIIMLLKLAQKHWDDEKLVSITDSSGEQRELAITGSDLEDIDFDLDIDIDIESVSVNKEVLRAQAIELYDRVKDDPLIDRKMVFKQMLREGFNVRNPEAYMVDEAELGMMPMQGEQMGGQPLATPEGEGDVPTSQAGVLGGGMGY